MVASIGIAILDMPTCRSLLRISSGLRGRRAAWMRLNRGTLPEALERFLLYLIRRKKTQPRRKARYRLSAQGCCCCVLWLRQPQRLRTVSSHLAHAGRCPPPLVSFRPVCISHPLATPRFRARLLLVRPPAADAAAALARRLAIPTPATCDIALLPHLNLPRSPIASHCR